MTVAVQDHLEGRRPSKEVNVRLRMNSGEYRWVWARGKVVEWDGTSSPLLMVGTISDIHEQLQAAESLQRTQFVVDTALEAIFWIDSAGRFTYVNEEACRSLNSSREELLKLSVFDIDADFTEDKWPARMEAIRKGTLPTQEFRHRTRDGRIFPVEIATSYHMFGDREFTCSFARDISKRKRMECVMEALTVSLAGLTGQAYLTGALQSLADLTGAEVVMITDFSFSDEDKLHMIACWKDGQLLQEMKYQMSGTPCERVARERFFTCQSGVADLFPGAKHLRDWEIESYAGARIADRSGNFIGVLAVMGRRPLSNLEEVRSTLNLFALSAAAELARQRNSAQLREVFDSAPDFMLMIDQKGRIISVNHASMQMLGYSEEDLIGQPMEMLVPEQLRQKHAQLQDDYFRQPRLRFMGEPGMALHVRKKNGELLPVDINLRPVMTVSGQCVIAAIRDVSLREKYTEELLGFNARLEEQVRQRTSELEEAEKSANLANQAKTIFLANMSHELRSPLQAIIGFNELVKQDSKKLSAKARHYLDNVHLASEQLLSVINQVLDISKIEAGYVELWKTNFDAGAELEMVVGTMIPMATERKVVLQYAGGEFCHVHADASCFQRIVMNLISNAIKFTPPRGAP